MRIERIKDKTSFGIYKGYRPTNYGSYMWGTYKNYKIEVFNSVKDKQKLIYVTDSQFAKWVKSKLMYYQNGIKRITRCANKLDY